MNKQQIALNNLQESVQYINSEINSEEYKCNLDKVEMLQDKFDALLQIIETQAHRVRHFLLIYLIINQLLLILLLSKII